MDFFLKSVLLMLVIEVGYISAHYSSSEMYTPGANGSIVVHYVIKKVESALGATNELIDRLRLLKLITVKMRKPIRMAPTVEFGGWTKETSMRRKTCPRILA